METLRHFTRSQPYYFQIQSSETVHLAINESTIQTNCIILDREYLNTIILNFLYKNIIIESLFPGTRRINWGMYQTIIALPSSATDTTTMTTSSGTSLTMSRYVDHQFCRSPIKLFNPRALENWFSFFVWLQYYRMKMGKWATFSLIQTSPLAR